MAKYTPYALKELPTNGIDTNGVYFIKADTDDRFTIYLRKGDNSKWIELGIVDNVAAVNDLTGDVKIDLHFSSGKLKIKATGTGTAATITEINLDARYRKKSDDISWSDITGEPSFALDSKVVHLAHTETITGKKTFTTSPEVPTATSNPQAVPKSQLDDAIDDLQDEIDTLNTTVNSGLKYKGDIDASTNPDLPTADVGDTYMISKAGKIGGASGIDVQVGNTIICKEDTSSGSYSSVGDHWTILQSDLDQATETVAGFAKIATQAQISAATNDETIVTPKKLGIGVNNLKSELEGKYVRYDASQSLSNSEKNTARGNIDAPKNSEVVKLSGAQSVGGKKSFTTIPEGPSSDPTKDDQLARKKYVDEQTADAVKWGDGGKEW